MIVASQTTAANGAAEPLVVDEDGTLGVADDSVADSAPPASTSASYRGATAEEWFQFDFVLGLGANLLPCVPAGPDVRVVAGSALEGKVGKIPSVFNHEGLAHGMKDWQKREIFENEVALWSKDRRLNICLRLGPISGVYAFDVDIEGDDALKVQKIIEDVAGPLPLRLRSNSKKRLFAFRMDAPCKKRKIKLDMNPRGPAIELLADGQQFVAAGTHSSGVLYQWSPGLPQELPTLTLNQVDQIWAKLSQTFATPASAQANQSALAPSPTPPALESQDGPRSEISESEWSELQDALRFLRDKVESNDLWSQVGYALLSIQGARPVQQLWLDWSKESAGYEPGAPEAWWDAHARSATRTDYRHVFTVARQRGWGATSSLGSFKPVTADPGAVSLTLVVEPQQGFPDVVFREPRADLYDNPPPPREFMLGGYVPKRAASKFSGPGQLGKSYLMIYGAVCQALGLNFLGRPCQAGRVVYISAEDEHEEYERRLHRVLHSLYRTGLPEDVRGLLEQNLHFVDLTGQGGKQLLTNIVDHGRVVITPFARYVADRVAEHQADLVIFDTQSRFNGGSENDNTAGSIFIDALELVAKITGAATVVISHVGKHREYDTDQYDRGASSLVDNTRGGMKLTQLTDDEANKLIDAQQAKAKTKDLLRVSHSKRSYSAQIPDTFVERQSNGVLLPALLIYNTPTGGASAFAPSPSDYVAYLLNKVGDDEVRRSQVHKHYQEWCGPTATREMAVQAFDMAVNSGRLLFSREYRSAKWYRATPADQTTPTVTPVAIKIRDADAGPPDANEEELT